METTAASPPVTQLSALLQEARARRVTVVGVRNRSYLDGRIALAMELLRAWGAPAPVAEEAALAPHPRLSSTEKKLVPYRALLGTRSDSAIARLVGLAPGTVAKLREAWGIPAYARTVGVRPLRPWQKQIKDRLGVVSDAELAREVRRSRERVRQFRASLEIPAAPDDGSRPASKRVLTDGVRELYGVLPDSEIAGRAGVSLFVIARWRREYTLPVAVGRPPSKLAALHGLFGKVSDSEIARRAGIANTNVIEYRHRHPELPPSPFARTAGRPRKHAPAVDANTRGEDP